MRKQSIEILKNFSEYSSRDIIEALTDIGIIIKGSVSSNHSDFDTGLVALHVLKDDGHKSRIVLNRLFGKASLIRHSSGGNIPLNKYFKHPLLPTEEERTLFEIELGFEYCIKGDLGDIL